MSSYSRVVREKNSRNNISKITETLKNESHYLLIFNDGVIVILDTNNIQDFFLKKIENLKKIEVSLFKILDLNQ